MFRKLLACLALLTGLAAAGAPAQAEIAVAMASRMETSASGDQALRSQARAISAQPSLQGDFAHEGLTEVPGELARSAPSVRLGSDRARE